MPPKPRGVTRRLASVSPKCTSAKCEAELTSSHRARQHAKETGHTVRETRLYKIEAPR